MYIENLHWYNSLIKSYLIPSAKVFTITWGFIYLTILASFLIFASKGINKEKIFPIAVFLIQLILNMIWSPIFFLSHALISAFIITILLTIAIILNIILFWKHSKLAACLLIPYLIWVIFASYLNFELIRLNNF